MREWKLQNFIGIRCLFNVFQVSSLTQVSGPAVKVPLWINLSIDQHYSLKFRNNHFSLFLILTFNMFHDNFPYQFKYIVYIFNHQDLSLIIFLKNTSSHKHMSYIIFDSPLTLFDSLSLSQMQTNKQKNGLVQRIGTPPKIHHP